MSTPILATKLYIPPPRPEVVPRPRLIKRLNEGLCADQGLRQNQGLRQSQGFGRKLTLISAPAGFGKTTLLSEWVAGCDQPTAWLSLDEGDNDLTRFLNYVVAALQTIEGNVGQGLLAALQSPGAVNVEAVLTTLINEIASLPNGLVLVLDDYHVIDAQPVEASTSVDGALTFLLEHLPPQMHLVIASRSDPSLRISRLRAGGQMIEIREDDLRFTPDEVAAFLDKVMGLDLSAENVAALGARTEGWVAGLQLAALAMQGTLAMQETLSTQGLSRSDAITDFVNRFTGSHRYIQDYLADEVLQRRPKGTQDFLLQTSILNRMCGPLCDAVRFGKAKSPSSSEGTAVRFGTTAVAEQENSQAILEALEAANLFLIPLDNERRWYRYHHLFADLLRQRLQQNPPPLSPSASSGQAPPAGGTPLGREGDKGGAVAELHRRASVWYEDNGLEIEAFQHAAAANDVERAARLIEGEGMPLYYRGAMAPVLNWLELLPTTVLDANPSLWVTYASALMVASQPARVEEMLQAAEAALKGAEAAAEADDTTRDLVGRIAALRAILAAGEYQVETIITQSRRALENLHPDNLPVRTTTTWTLGYAYQLQRDRAAACQAYTEAVSICEASGNIFINILASTGLGQMQEADNHLHLAAETYRRVLQLVGDPPWPSVCEAHLGLARVCYEWNDLDAAQQHGQQSLQLARQIENIDSFVACEVILARLKLAQGDVAGAAAMLAEAAQSARQHNFVYMVPKVAAAQVVALLRQGPLLHQGNLAAAAHLAETHDLPISQARVHLAREDPGAALATLEPLRQQAEAKGWEDERLKVMVLEAVAHQANGERDEAVQRLGDALAMAEPGGFIRIFVDEGLPMAHLLSEAAARGIMPDYVGKLLAAFEDATKDRSARPTTEPSPSSLVEPLSQRELEVLQLIAQGLSNREISERLFLALDTVKGHNRRIYGKLQVHRRTEAVARARELGLI